MIGYKFIYQGQPGGMRMKKKKRKAKEYLERAIRILPDIPEERK